MWGFWKLLCELWLGFVLLLFFLAFGSMRIEYVNKPKKNRLGAIRGGGRALSVPLPTETKGPRTATKGIIRAQFLLRGLRRVCKSPCLYIIGIVIRKSPSSTMALVRLVTSMFSAPNKF